MIESGQCKEAMYRLNQQLYDLRYDRYAQNQLLREISDNLARNRGGYLNLDKWNPNRGTWDTIEIVPIPPAAPPDQPPPPVEAPIPVPTYEDDPWIQLESNVVPALLDAGDSHAAASRLNSDLFNLRGNLDAQNILLSMVDSNDKKGSASDLKLGEWNPATGTYDSAEILPALTDPGKGIDISTFDNVDAPAPADFIDTTNPNDATDPWMHEEIAVIGALLDAGDAKAAATRLVADLQLLKPDLNLQNDLLAWVYENQQNGSGADISLGSWDEKAGTYVNIEILSAGAPPGTGIAIKTYAD